jgi:arylsulfatase A-like enzyme
MDYLAKHALEDNTVLLFVSDNGGVTANSRGGGKPFTHNLPLSSGKCAAHEGGIRVPMIVKWPGVVRTGTVCNDALIIEDFFPTLLEIAGVTLPDASQVDGVSFMPMLKGGSAPPGQRALIWHYPNSSYHLQGPGHGTYSIIRQGDWKYIFYYDPERPVREELFNIREDLGETRNLVQTHPDTRGALRQALAEYLTKVDAQFPIDKKTGDIVRP